MKQQKPSSNSVTVWIAFFLSATAAAATTSISTVGGGTDWDETNQMAYRSSDVAKGFDADGDNVYGSAGSVLFGNPHGTGQQTGLAFSNHFSALPDWVTSVSAGTNFALIADGYPGYGAIDDPTLPAGPDVADWPIFSGIALSTSGAQGDYDELVTFSIGPGAPQKFRVGVLSGNEQSANFRWCPTAIRLTGPDGSSATVANLTGFASNACWVFFDVDTGGATNGTFGILGQKRLTTQGPSIGGFTIDGFTPSAPTIVTAPTGGEFHMNTALTLNVLVAGTLPISYQWWNDQGPVAEATNATLPFSSLDPADSGSYSVVVTNSVGSITSAPVALVVQTLWFETQPAGESLAVGSPLNLSVEVGGLGPFTYEWLRYGTVVSGPTTSSASNSLFSIPSVGISDEGSYTVVVTNSSMSITSAPAMVEVKSQLAGIATVGGGNDWDEYGQPAFLSTDAPKGFDADGDNVYGSAGYLMFGTPNGGNNQFGQAFTNNVNALPSWVTSVSAGSNFASVAYGYSTYAAIDDPLLPAGTDVPDWAEVSGVAVSAAGSQGDYDELLEFTIGPDTPERFRVGVLSGNEGSSNSRWCPTAIRLTGPDGSEAAVTNLTAVYGSANWVFFDVDTAGETNGTFGIWGQKRLTTQGPSIGGFTLDDFSPSAPAMGTILIQPAVGINVASPATILAGSPVTLIAVAHGTLPFSYQWWKGTEAIAGATNSTLSFTNLSLSDAGDYTVAVTNSAGGAVSSAVTLNITTNVSAQLVRYRAAVQMQPGIFAWYQFDFYNAEDLTAQHNGTLVGSTGFGTGVGGGVDEALLLNGNGHVNLDYSDDFHFNDGTGTVEAWIRADWAGNPGYNPCLFAVRDGTPTRYSIQMTADKNSLEFYNGAANSYLTIPNAGTNWHHVAVVFEVTNSTPTWSLYWDGTLAGTATNDLGSGLGSGAVPAILGSTSTAGAGQWIGALDEVVYYSDALDAQSIGAQYDAFQPPILNAVQAGNQLVLSWLPPGYKLQENSNLTNNAGWTDVAGGTNSPITIDIGASNQFYRLIAIP